jgi:2-oxopent-4-enoate/cis-2-oxohex-4-enoate hydratase
VSDDLGPITDRLLAALEAGEPAPADLAGTVEMDTAYRIQLEVLRRGVAAGRRHAGWKIGLTNPTMRSERGESSPAPGFLFKDAEHESGTPLELAGADDWYLEPELALVLAYEVKGPGITAERVREAVSRVVAAFELVRRRPGWEDRALSRALNVASAGYLLGTGSRGCPEPAALDALPVNLRCDRESKLSTRAGEVNDNPLESTAGLANFLAPLGESRRPGQVILTGSMSALQPLRARQRWQASLGALGAVELDVE